MGSEKEEQEKEEKGGWREHPDARREDGRMGQRGRPRGWGGAAGPGGCSGRGSGAPGLRSAAPPGSCCPLPPRRDGTVPAPGRCRGAARRPQAGSVPAVPPCRTPQPQGPPPAPPHVLARHRLPEHATLRGKGPRGWAALGQGLPTSPSRVRWHRCPPAHPRAGATSGPRAAGASGRGISRGCGPGKGMFRG